MANQTSIENTVDSMTSALAEERSKLEPKIKELQKVALDNFKNYPAMIARGHVDAIKEVAKEKNQAALFNTWNNLLNKIVKMTENIKMHTDSSAANLWELKEVECVAEELLQNENHKVLVDFYFYSSQLEKALGDTALIKIFNAKFATGDSVELSNFSSEYIKAIQWVLRFPLFFSGKPLPQEDKDLEAKFAHFNKVFTNISKDINEYQRGVEKFIVNGMSLARLAEEANAIPELIEDGLTFEEFISLFPEGAGVIPTELLQKKGMKYTELLKSPVKVADLNVIAAKMNEMSSPVQVKIELDETLSRVLTDDLRERKISVHKLVEIKNAYLELKSGRRDSSSFIKILKKAGVKLHEKDINLIKQTPVDPTIAKLNAKVNIQGDHKPVVMPAVSSQSFHDFDKAWKDVKPELNDIFKVFHSKPVIMRYVGQILEATSFITILNNIAHESRLGTVEKMKLKRLADAVENAQQKFAPIKEVLEVGKKAGKYKHPEAEEMALLTTAARVGNSLVFLVIKEFLPHYAGNAEQLGQLIREIKLAMQGENPLNAEEFKGQMQAAFPEAGQVGLAYDKIFTEYQRQELIRKIKDEALSFNLRQILSVNPQIQLTERLVKIINKELIMLQHHEISLQKFSNHLSEYLNWPVTKPDFQGFTAGHQQFVRNELQVDAGYQQGLHLTALMDDRLEKIQEVADDLNKQFKKPLWGAIKDFPALLKESQETMKNFYEATAQVSKTLKILQHIDKPNFSVAMQCKESKVDTYLKGWQHDLRTVTVYCNVLERNCLRNLQDTVKSFNQEVAQLHNQAEKMYTKKNAKKLEETFKQCQQMQNKISGLMDTIDKLPNWHDQNLQVSMQVAKANLAQLKEGDLMIATSYTQNCVRKLKEKGVISANYSFADNVKALFGFKKKEPIEIQLVQPDLHSLSSIKDDNMSENEIRYIAESTGKNKASIR